MLEGYQGRLGPSGGLGGVRHAFGAGRECRYSGSSRGIGGIRGLLGGVRGASGTVRGLGTSGGVGVSGCIGAGRECGYLEANRVYVASGAPWGVRGHWWAVRRD